MRYHRGDVVQRALEVLDDYGLADLTMRRLGSELGVQPSALYHHFANKQTLLAAVADEILARGLGDGHPGEPGEPEMPREQGEWDARLRTVCRRLRDAMLAWRDGAELVATVHAFGLGAHAAYEAVDDALVGSGLPAGLRATAARTLLHLVFGHTGEEQTRLQASSAGAIDAEPPHSSDFDAGLALLIDGIRVRVGQPTTR
ncbi:TetR/AcrR family transcriptional regulator C-terminal domain-containing protein [Nocardioides campestrisoli]|uniref:TetR/AcrR family transcriptional regulator C-terminal domain-containing protein n=1 Tax=Nocardioides campestrisoli TaxID=2736757 RepID=UPI0015E6A8F6|nr:TetR/AcrR family transcriptional regulator C-terminal domain-containing protein [Nocardioides campestrisoli]